MRLRNAFFTLFGVGLLALAPLSGHAQDQKTYNWKMATSWPGGGPLTKIGAQAFADRLEQVSGGRFHIQVFPGGTLGNALKVSETVRNGLAQMGHTWMGYDWGQDTTTVLFGGYAGSFDTLRMLHWLYEDGGVDLQRQFRLEKFDVISMPLFVRNAEVFLHSRKPVRTLADLKGLKIRTAGAWLEISRELGAAPVTMPGGDIYTALERGVIDATEWGSPWENISTGFYKVTKYVIYPGVHQPTAPFELIINKDAWNSLSDADKKLIETTAQEVTMEAWLKLGAEDIKAMQFYKDHGNTLIHLSKDVQYKGRELALKWGEKQAKENPWFDKVFESQRAFEKQWVDADSIRNVELKREDELQLPQ